MPRTAQIQRRTSETSIEVLLDLDGNGRSRIATGVGFFDHMLTLFAKHAAVDLEIRADGDLHIDQHHTVEDVGIVLGTAFDRALGDKSGIRRYGHFTLPMDETLATAAVDFGGRPHLVFQARFPSPKIGQFDTELVREFWQAFTNKAAANLHVIVHHGENGHHIAEAVFKATARAVRMALEPDGRIKDVPSTKGTL
ncbi:imidazoleglycerol-phosphate dehydratase HisB [Thermostilla marina]